MQWNAPTRGWNAGAVMADASLNRRQTIQVGAGVAFAQVGIVGFDGPINLQSLRLFGLQGPRQRCFMPASQYGGGRGSSRRRCRGTRRRLQAGRRR